MTALRDCFIFQEREKIADGAGNTRGVWTERFRIRADVIYRQGNEVVIASRLTGVVPAFLKIRKSNRSDMITTAWRCIDERTREIYNIKAKTPDTETRLFYLITLEGGVAT